MWSFWKGKWIYCLNRTKQWGMETWINKWRLKANSRAEKEEHKQWSTFLLCLWATALRKSRSAHQVVDCATVWCWTLLRMLFLCNTRVQGTVKGTCVKAGKHQKIFFSLTGGQNEPIYLGHFLKKLTPVTLQNIRNWPISEHIFLWTSLLVHWKCEELPSALHLHLKPFRTEYTKPASEPLKALQRFFLHHLFGGLSSRISTLRPL